MRGLWLVGLAALAVGGCNSARERETVASVEAEQAACRAQTFKRAVDRAACLNKAAERVVPLTGSSSDLARVAMATRLVLAERVDKGQITQAEANLQMAQTLSGLNATERGRDAADQEARLRRAAATPQWQPVVAPISQPQQTTCVTEPYLGRLQTTCR